MQRRLGHLIVCNHNHTNYANLIGGLQSVTLGDERRAGAWSRQPERQGAQSERPPPPFPLAVEMRKPQAAGWFTQ